MPGRGRHINLEIPQRRTFSVGLIGAGYWGERHLLACHRHDSVGSIVVWDHDARRISALLARSPKAVSADSLDDCLEQSDVTLVCTPATTHADLVRRCLVAGLPTLVEKPMAKRLADCERLFDLARDVDKYVMVGHQYRHHVGVVECRRFFERHAGLGSVTITTTRHGGSVRPDVDVLLDLAVHDLTVLREITGAQPARVSMVDFTESQDGLLEAASLSLTYPGDVTAQVSVAWIGPRRRRVRIETSGGGCLVLDEPDTGVPTIAGSSLGPAWRAPLEGQLDHFLRRAPDGFSEDEADDVLAVMSVLDQLSRAGPHRLVGTML